MLSLLIAAFFGYVILAALFLVATSSRMGRRAKWLGLAAIVAAAPALVWFGAFGEQTAAGQCYSKINDYVARAVERTDAPRALAEQISALPFRGYETSCSEVEAAASKLPNAAP
jgi:hypothetical protein